MSLYKKVGIRYSRSGQVIGGLLMLGVVVILTWSFIRNGSATWKVVPIALFVLALIGWQVRGYARRDDA